MKRCMRMDRGRSAVLAITAVVASAGFGWPAQALAQESDQDQIEAVQQEQEIRRARLLAEYDAAYQTATDKLAQMDFEGAERAILTAQIQVRQNQSLLSSSQFAELDNKAEDLLTEIDQGRIRQRLIEEAERQRDILVRTRLAEEDALRERQRLINQNLLRVRQLQMELKYEEALQVIDEILFIDEHSPAALALKEIIKTLMLYRQWDEVQRQKERGLGQISLENQDAMIPPIRNFTGPGLRSISGVMAYPPDWPNISLIRTGEGGFRESVADRRVRMALNDIRVPLDFAGHSFDQVISFLGQTTGQTIYVDWKALEFINVDQDDEITLQLADRRAHASKHQAQHIRYQLQQARDQGDKAAIARLTQEYLEQLRMRAGAE